MHAPFNPAFRVEWRALTALDSIVDEWRALAARAIEPNVFYEPTFALAAAPVFGENAGATLVWSTTGRLMGFFPARIERWRGGLCSATTGWTHPYAPLGVPLVDRDQAEVVLGAWLDHLAGDPARPALLLMPLVTEGGPFAAALDAALAGGKRQSAPFSRYQRALLAPGTERDGYLERAMPTRKRNKLRKQRDRLEDIAPVTFGTTAGVKDIGAALKDFLLIEASGWKALAGTATVLEPAIRKFVEAAVKGLAATGQARVDRLFLNGRAIAAFVTLSSGSTAWCWKIAYNEGVSRASPGAQLALDFTEAVLAESNIARVDSCADADHPMIDGIWRERLALCDRLVALRPSVWPFGLVCRLEALRRGAIVALKALRDRLRDRKSTARPEQAPDDLTGGRHRHLVNEGDLARILMRGQPGAHERLDVGGKRV